MVEAVLRLFFRMVPYKCLFPGIFSQYSLRFLLTQWINSFHIKAGSWPMYGVDHSSLAHSPTFLFPVIPECPGINYIVNQFLSANTVSELMFCTLSLRMPWKTFPVQSQHQFWICRCSMCCLPVCKGTDPLFSLRWPLNVPYKLQNCVHFRLENGYFISLY